MLMTTFARGTLTCLTVAVLLSGCSSGESDSGAQSALGLAEESDQPPEESSGFWGPTLDVRVRTVGNCVVIGSRSTVFCPGADMRGGNLRGFNLTGANLAGANLSGANLSYVSAFEADFRGANLTGASVTGLQLGGADLSEAVWTDGRVCAAGSIGTCR